MTDENDVCPNSPSHDAPKLQQCTKVQCGPFFLSDPLQFLSLPPQTDKTEEEAYWAEVEENAMIGGAGFREPGEPHIH